MHPEIASLLAEHLLEAGRTSCLQDVTARCVRNIFAALKFNEATKAPEKPRTSPTGISLTNTRFLLYKKRIFLTRNHFVRQPASRSAESAISSSLRFLKQTSLRRDQGIERSQQSTAQAVPLRASDEIRKRSLPPPSVLGSFPALPLVQNRQIPRLALAITRATHAPKVRSSEKTYVRLSATRREFGLSIIHRSWFPIPGSADRRNR